VFPEQSPKGQENNMTIIATLKSNSTSGRALRRKASTDGAAIGFVPPEVVMNATEKKISTKKGEFGNKSLIGDEAYFVENTTIRGSLEPKSGWVFARYGGEHLCIVTPAAEEQPSEEPPDELVHPGDVDEEPADTDAQQPPDLRQYYRILQDDEMPFYSRPAGEGSWPAVFRLEEHHFVTLTKEWQEVWFGANRSDDWNADYKAWMAYTESSRAFTNGNGILEFDIRDGDQQIRRDYIGDTGKTLPDPKIATLVTARNVLCGEEEKLTQKVGKIPSGTWVLKVETMRVPDLTITRQTHPHLIHVATIILNKNAPNGLRQINPFPQRGGRAGYPVHYPVVSNKQVYYPLDQLEKLKIGDPLPPVYNPP
jgi:hypothetical protein